MTEEERIMVKVQVTGTLSPRRDWSPYLRSHPKVWQELRARKPVLFPEDEIHLMNGSISRAVPTPAMEPGKPPPRRVVKDNQGNIWHDGVLAGGPAFEEKRRLERVSQSEVPGDERIRRAMEATEAKRAQAAVAEPPEESPETPEPEEELSEASPSSEEEASEKSNPKRIRPSRKRRSS